MKKFFIKVECLIVNSLLVTLSFLFLVIWCSFLTVVALITTICGIGSWCSLKLRLLRLWTGCAEVLNEAITYVQEFDKDNYGI